MIIDLKIEKLSGNEFILTIMLNACADFLNYTEIRYKGVKYRQFSPLRDPENSFYSSSL